MDPFPSLNKVYSLMIQEEAQSLLLIVPIQGLNQLPWLPNHRMSMSIPGLIMLETMGMKEKISQFAPIVVSLVTPLISQCFPFPFNNKLSSYAFDLIHLDVGVLMLLLLCMVLSTF